MKRALHHRHELLGSCQLPRSEKGATKPGLLLQRAARALPLRRPRMTIEKRRCVSWRLVGQRALRYLRGERLALWQ
jgi:hypothetical protein